MRTNKIRFENYYYFGTDDGIDTFRKEFKRFAKLDPTDMYETYSRSPHLYDIGKRYFVKLGDDGSHCEMELIDKYKTEKSYGLLWQSKKWEKK
jgi:hypothetical protein